MAPWTIIRQTQQDTKGKNIFDALKMYFNEKGIPLKNILSLPTYCAPTFN